jgi:hypothetical protein
MIEKSTNQSNPVHKSLLIEAVRNKLTEELKRDNFLKRLFENKYFNDDLRPDQVELPYSELDFGNFHIECVDEICLMQNLKWTLPGKVIVNEAGNQQNIVQITEGVFTGFISKIKYRIESIHNTDEQVPNILEFELTKPIPIVRG